AFEADRHAFRIAVGDVAVEAVVRRVERAVGEPAVERRLRLVEHLGERLLPCERLAREPRPEALVVARRLGIERREVGGLDVRLRRERGRRRKEATLVRDGLDVRHAAYPRGWTDEAG